MNDMKRIWFILDEIAVKHSASHAGSKNTPCDICDLAVEAMRLCTEKPTHEECVKLYIERGDR